LFLFCVLNFKTTAFFGLSATEFACAGQCADAVIHNGCNVNGIYPYSLLKDTNVGGTVEAIRLCAINNAHLVFVSSISALANSKEGFETTLNPKNIDRISSGYVKSKLICFDSHICFCLGPNKARCRASDRNSQIQSFSLLFFFSFDVVSYISFFFEKGLVASVVRPGTIGPVSFWNENDTLTKLFVGMNELKSCPHVKQLVSVAPVNWVARVVVSAPPGALLNVMGQSVEWESLCPVEFTKLPLRDFVAFVQRNPANTLAPLLSYFSNKTFPLGDDPSFASGASTSQLVEQLGIGACPFWTPPKQE
jgi:hypothetical protein